MKSERNNGYLASTVVIEQSADLPESTSQDSISTPNSLQVTYGSRGGTTTSVLQHPIKPQRPIGVTRVTSITRRRRGTVSRQRLLGVLAITLLATCLFILLLLALNTTRECVREPHPNVCMTEECVQTAASLLAAMDRTVAPCVDFFQYACGTWNRLHVIPEDRSAISTFEILADQLQVILKRVLEEPPNANDNNATLKAKMFYRSCMDIPRIREIGDAPLKKILERLGGWPAVVGTSWRPPPYPLEVLLGRLRGEYNVGVLMEQWVGPDDKNSSVNILQLDQMQLALPSRDYYLKKVSEVQLKAYHNYMTNVAILLGANPHSAPEEFDRVIALEKQLANLKFMHGNNENMNRGGRPCHKYWEEGNFEKYYEGQKLFAYCSYCKRVIRHSAENRLRDHRKQCQEDKLQNETVDSPGEIIFIVDENIENNADVSATSHSTDILITNTSCDVASSSSQLLKRPVLLPIDGNQKGSSSNKKRKLDSFVDKISDTDKSVIDNQLMKFLCGCNITFDVVESCHFKNLIKLLRPAYKLPSKDIMNTTLLDTMYQQLTKNNSSNCEKLDKILMVSQINYTADTKHIIGVLYSKNKENLFLKLWTLAGNENDVSEIIRDAVKTAKLKYNADVYAVIAGDNLCINDNGLDLWFFECQATIAKKITKSLLNIPLISKVRTLLNAFNTPQLKQEIINRGGMKFELLNDNESCFFIKDILNACLKNRLIMKQIVATGEFTFQNDIIMTLFDSTSSSFSSSSFEEDLRKIICLYEHFCSLISKCENPTESIADITEEWLKIESAIVEEYRGCMDEICEQISSIMSPMLLAANFLHPVYRGHMFENNTERVTAVFEYLLEVLDSEGLDDYHAFSKGKGLFEKLSQHKIVDPEKYWDYAEKKHPSLTKFASKLMQVPASVLQIKFQSLCKNDISDDNGKMIELYYQLKLKDKNVTDKY